MGINFAALESQAAQQEAQAPLPQMPAEAGGGVKLDLTKNNVLNLTKENPGLKHIKLGAGWDISKAGVDVDIDIFAILADSNDKAVDIVYFRKLEAAGVKLDGDNRTGAGEGDDETIHIDLANVPANVERIIACVDIYEGQSKGQTFGMVSNAYVRILDEDAGDKQLCVFPLSNDYATDTAVIVAELVREGNKWIFHTLGEGLVGDINSIYNRYC